MSRKKPYVTEKMNYTMSAVNFSSKASEFRAEACQNIDDVSTRQKQKFLWYEKGLACYEKHNEQVKSSQYELNTMSAHTIYLSFPFELLAVTDFSDQVSMLRGNKSDRLLRTACKVRIKQKYLLSKWTKYTGRLDILNTVLYSPSTWRKAC